jgi:Mg/Co/Ni transporter MgtE
MKPEDIHLTDWMRMLLGEVPWSFLLEITLRIIFLYALILVSMWLMGQRMAGQVSRNEMAALVSLVASVGIPMQAPDRGLLPAVVVAAAVVGVQRWVAYQAYKDVNRCPVLVLGADRKMSVCGRVISYQELQSVA